MKNKSGIGVGVVRAGGVDVVAIDGASKHDDLMTEVGDAASPVPADGLFGTGGWGTTVGGEQNFHGFGLLMTRR